MWNETTKREEALIDRCDELIAFILSNHEQTALPEEVCIAPFLTTSMRGTLMQRLMTEAIVLTKQHTGRYLNGGWRYQSNAQEEE